MKEKMQYKIFMERVTASQRRRIQKLEPLRRGSLESGRESGT